MPEIADATFVSAIDWSCMAAFSHLDRLSSDPSAVPRLRRWSASRRGRKTPAKAHQPIIQELEHKVPKAWTERDLRPFVHFVRYIALHRSGQFHGHVHDGHGLLRVNRADERCHLRLRMIEKADEVPAGQVEGVAVFAMEHARFPARWLHGNNVMPINGRPRRPARGFMTTLRGRSVTSAGYAAGGRPRQQ